MTAPSPPSLNTEAAILAALAADWQSDQTRADARTAGMDRTADQQAIARTAQAEVLGLWQGIAGDPAAAWPTIGPLVVDRVSRAQYAAAAGADGYLSSLATDVWGIPDGSTGIVAPSALAGVASDGRPLESLLAQSALRTGLLLAQGISYRDAMTAGSANLLMHTSTQIFDAGRAAEQTAAVARPWAGYSVRVTSGRACSRCAILAGRRYRWSTQFRRHPNCACRNVFAPAQTEPVQEPRALFDALTKGEQDRRYTAAGAEAIRQGADPLSVVNARRGMTTAAGRPTTTTEGTGRRGTFTYQRRAIDALTNGRANRPMRLMPEEIIRLAAGSRSEARRLLIGNGYILGDFNALAAEYRLLTAAA